MRCPIESRTPLGDHSDAAKRIADTFALHRLADPYGNIGYWFAAALSDGQTDGTLYESRPHAIRHQHHNEEWYAYIQIVPANLSSCEAETILRVARRAYDSGIARGDGMTRHELIRRLGWEDQIALSKGFPTNVSIGRN